MIFSGVFPLILAGMTARSPVKPHMNSQRTHYVTTTDGVTIGATVHGRGPALVFLQGVIGDGDLDWHALLEHLTPRFTCHLPSLRGRGLSGDHPDVTFGRLVHDVLAYVDSVGEPTGLVGWSLGAGLALVAAGAQSPAANAVQAVAAVEPLTPRLWNEPERAAFGEAVARMGELAAKGMLTDAARAFAGFPFTDEDIAVAEGAGYFEAAGRYVPKALNFFRQQMDYRGPTDDDPAVLGAISAPVLVLLGSVTKPHSIRAARHVASHALNARIQEIPGAGHAAPLTHPKTLAEVLTDFFSRTQPPA